MTCNRAPCGDVEAVSWFRAEDCAELAVALFLNWEGTGVADCRLLLDRREAGEVIFRGKFGMVIWMKVEKQRD